MWLAAALGMFSGASVATATPVSQGGPVDLLTEANVRIDGQAGDDWAGNSVAGAGDVNEDGIDDVIVGAPFADNNGRSLSGSAYVVYGRTSPTNLDLESLGAHGFRIDGQAASDQAGYSVAGAGDVNDDGIDDVIVGAFGADNNGRSLSGSAYVVYGGASPTNLDLQSLGARGFRIDGQTASDWAGSSVAGAGDVNEDGIDDVVVGANDADNNGRGGSGSAYVVYGGASPTNVDLDSLGARGFRIDGQTASDQAGFSVAGAGDVNEDGIDDVVVGANDADNNGRSLSGSAYVVYGGASPTNLDLQSLGARGFRIDGQTASDWAGSSVAGAGDVNEDGIDDVVVGANDADNNGRGGSGSAYVVYGGASPTNLDLQSLGARGFRIDGQAVSDRAGYSVAGAGDVNEDGIDDVAVGAFDADNNGREDSGSAYVVYGGASPTNLDLQSLGARGFRIDGQTASDQAGASVAGAGDVNEDGIDDVVVGASLAGNNGRGGSGSAYVVYGGASLTHVDLDSLGARGLRIDGQAAGDRAGLSVAGAGDVNDDGIDDVVVGAPTAGNNGRQESGSAYVVNGALPAPRAGASPAALDFGPRALAGGPSAPETATIENDGTAPLQIGTPAIAGPQASDFAISADGCDGQTLAPGATCTVDLTFDPSAPGTRSATLEVPSDDPASPLQVSLTGTGTAPDITGPATLDFGPRALAAGPSAPETATIENDGTAPLQIGTPAIAGPQASDFAISADGCDGQTLAPGATCTVDVTFDPSAPGTRSATLQIPSDDPDTATLQVSLTGEGLGEPPSGAYLPQAGTVVVEAEHAQVIDRSGTGWVSTTSPAGAVGQAMVVPEAGQSWGGIATALAQAPELRFLVDFPTAGTWYVSVRANPANAGADSVHVAIDGQITADSDHVNKAANGQWQWMRYSAGGPNPARITVPSAGLHEVSIFAREDGTVVDRMVLSTSTAQPAGSGPPESPRDLGPDSTPPTVSDVTPDADASGVPVGQSVSVVFSEPIAAASITSTSVVIADGSPLAASRSLSPSGTVLTIDPDQDLGPGTTYSVTLGPGITDAAGNPLDGAPVSWSFTTAASGSGAYLPQAGTVVVEAEHAQVIDRSGTGWVSTTSPAGAVGQAMVVPEAGQSWGGIATALAQAPELRFLVDFPTAGTWYVSVRANPANAGADSVHVAIDGQITADSDHVNKAANGQWQWMRYSAGGPNPARITVPSAGLHEVSIFAREDGTVVDRMVLSTSTAQPAGSGPPESPRV